MCSKSVKGSCRSRVRSVTCEIENGDVRAYSFRFFFSCFLFVSRGLEHPLVGVDGSESELHSSATLFLPALGQIIKKTNILKKKGGEESRREAPSLVKMAEEGVELLGKGRLIRSGGKKKTYSRVKLNGVVYSCGDAVFLRAGSPGELPYIAKLKSFFKKRNEVYMNVDWFYRSSDTHMRRGPKYPNEIFITTTGDENHIRTIIQKVSVSSFFVEGNAASGPFFCTQRYNPGQKKFTPLPGITGMPDSPAARSSKRSTKKASKGTSKLRGASSKAPAKTVAPSSATSASSTTSASSGTLSVASATSSTEDSTASPGVVVDASSESVSANAASNARSKRKVDELSSLPESAPELASGSTDTPMTCAVPVDVSEIVKATSPPGSLSDTKADPSPQPAEKRVRVAERAKSSAGPAISSIVDLNVAKDTVQAVPKDEDVVAPVVLDLADLSGDSAEDNGCDNDGLPGIDSGGGSQPEPEPDFPGTATDRVPVPRIGARYQVTSVPPVFCPDQLSNELSVNPLDPSRLRAQGLARRGAKPGTVLPPSRCIWEPIDERDEAAVQNCEQYLNQCAKLSQVKRRLFPGMSIAVQRSQRRQNRKHDRKQDQCNGNSAVNSAQTANTSQRESNHSPNSASSVRLKRTTASASPESLTVDLGVCMQSYSDHFSASMVEDLETQLKKAAPRMPSLPKLVRVQVKLDDERSPRFVALGNLVADQLEDFFLEKLHDASGDASKALKLVTRYVCPVCSVSMF